MNGISGNNENGQAALEAAIILIALVVVASVFAFAILSAMSVEVDCALTFTDLSVESATVTKIGADNETQADVDGSTVHLKLSTGVYWITAHSNDQTALGVAVVNDGKCTTGVAPR